MHPGPGIAEIRVTAADRLAHADFAIMPNTICTVRDQTGSLWNFANPTLTGTSEKSFRHVTCTSRDALIYSTHPA